MLMLTVSLFVREVGSCPRSPGARRLELRRERSRVTCAIMSPTATRRAGQERRQAAQHGIDEPVRSALADRGELAERDCEESAAIATGAP